MPYKTISKPYFMIQSPGVTLQSHLAKRSYTWLVTGVAGFIGSHLLETLLKYNQRVVGLDNFSSGYQKNLNHVQSVVGGAAWQNFRWIQGDIRHAEDCQKACANVDYVLHHAAMASVPASIENPALCHANNVDGFINLLIAARDANVKRVVYASSSAVYGDHPEMPKRETHPAAPLSPYAASKYMNELYAHQFLRHYGLESIGLRYFNIYGTRQDPKGAYAAVIPKWISALLHNENAIIYGDGHTTRDFCYIDDVVQANVLSALTNHPEAVGQTYNIATGESTSLNQLYTSLQKILAAQTTEFKKKPAVYLVGL